MENFSPEPYQNRFKKTNHRLGEGSSKIVFEAIDLDNGCSVAWNEVLTGHLDPTQKLQIEAEVGLLRSIQHPNIIDIIASWASPDKVVFVTEIVESGDLQRFYRSHRIRLRVIKKWCRQVLSALSYLHSRQPPIVHRDVKCENILYNAGDGTVKIGDLGLSAFAVTEGLATSDIVLGTPNYMAPEQYEGICDFTVDIYAFGMCVLEMVCGEIPYASCNAAQIYRRVSSGQLPESIWRIRSSSVQEFILHCLKPTEDGGKRPSAAQILLHPFLCEMTSTSEDDDVDLVLPRLRRPPRTPRTRLTSTLENRKNDRAIFVAKSLISESEGEGKVDTINDTVKNGDYNNEIDSDENAEEEGGEDEDDEEEEESEDEDEVVEEEEGEVEHTNLWEYDEWSGKVYDKHVSENGEQSKNEEEGSGSRYLIETAEEEDGFFYLGNDDDESLMDNSEESSVNGDVGWESGPIHTLDLDTIATSGSQVSLNQPQILFVENENFHFRSDIVRSDSVSSSVGLSVHEDRPEITLTTSDPLSPASFFSPTDGNRDTLDTGRGIGSKITDSGFINERDSPTGLNISTDDITGGRSLSAESPSIVDQNQEEMKLSSFIEAPSPQITIDEYGQMNNARSFSDSSRLTMDASSSLAIQQEQQLFQSNSDVKRINPLLASYFSTPKRTQKTKVHLELVLEQDTVVEGQTIVNRASITFDFDRVQSDASTTARELFSHLASVQRISVDELVFVPFLTALLETHRFECRVSSSAAFDGARLVLSPSAPRIEELT
jgi:serine/threonine protein kinase